MNGTEAAALFRAMADRIERGDPSEFSGAFLLVPPNGNPEQSNSYGGQVVDYAYFTSAPNPVAFWSSLLGQVELAVEDFKSSTAPQGGGRGRY